MLKHLNLLLSLILYVFIFVPLHAQKKSYSRGWIITLEGDTLEGWMKYRSTGTFPERYSPIRFKGDSKK